MFHFLFYHIRSSFAISYKTKKLQQRPTLPGDFSCLNPAQRAAEKILTKYNVARSSETTSEMDVTDAQSFFRAFPPTLPGDIVPLFRPQGAGDDILTKYNVAHWSG